MINSARFRPLSESGFRLIQDLILSITFLRLNFDRSWMGFRKGKQL